MINKFNEVRYLMKNISNKWNTLNQENNFINDMHNGIGKKKEENETN